LKIVDFSMTKVSYPLALRLRVISSTGYCTDPLGWEQFLGDVDETLREKKFGVEIRWPLE